MCGSDSSSFIIFLYLIGIAFQKLYNFNSSYKFYVSSMLVIEVLKHFTQNAKKIRSIKLLILQLDVRHLIADIFKIFWLCISV